MIKTSKQTVLDVKRTILLNNQYKLTHIRTKPIKDIDLQEEHDKRWAIFTYAGREIKNFTKLFKDAIINIA
jgi:hypothetical protein